MAKLDFFADQSVGAAGLPQEHLKRRYIVAPFDQGRNRTKAAQRFGVERPHLVSYAGTVIVNPQAAAVGKLADAVAGQVNFANDLAWQRRHIGCGIPAVISGAHKYVVNVAKNAAARPRRDGRHELPFWDRRMLELHVGGWVLDENLAPQRALHLIDVPANHVQRLVGHRQGKQIGKIGAVTDTPRNVLRHQRWLDPLGYLPDTIEMRLVQTLGTAERETDTMQRYGNIAPDGFQTADRRSATHVVFGMDFHEGDIGRASQHRLMVLEPQPDPGFGRDRIVTADCCQGHCGSALTR